MILSYRHFGLIKSSCSKLLDNPNDADGRALMSQSSQQISDLCGEMVRLLDGLRGARAKRPDAANYLASAYSPVALSYRPGGLIFGHSSTHPSCLWACIDSVLYETSNHDRWQLTGRHVHYLWLAFITHAFNAAAQLFGDVEVDSVGALINASRAHFRFGLYWSLALAENPIFTLHHMIRKIDLNADVALGYDYSVNGKR
ncbi:unnamed protein product [Protopolystoma xenopodis]|uniref:Uncharacterized protein n=1 Tax=Protopolystoma xenopodis TaxID=117903 RepID=A0A448WEL7_9PLAT|nr:unnamed protein product [Protopolystoma xenopodis]